MMPKPNYLPLVTAAASTILFALVGAKGGGALIQWERFDDASKWAVVRFSVVLCILGMILAIRLLWAEGVQEVDDQLDHRRQQAEKEARKQKARADRDFHFAERALRAREEKVEAAEQQIDLDRRQAEQIVEQAKADARKLARTNQPAKALPQVDEFLCDAMRMQVHEGVYLTAKVLWSPTGKVGVEWTLDPDVPPDLEVRVFLSGRLVIRGCGAGRYCTQLLRGKSYTFTLKADWKTKQKVTFAVLIPTEEQWARKAKAAGSAGANLDQLAAMEAELTEQIRVASGKQELIDRLLKEKIAKIRAEEPDQREQVRKEAALRSLVTQVTNAQQ